MDYVRFGRVVFEFFSDLMKKDGLVCGDHPSCGIAEACVVDVSQSSASFRLSAASRSELSRDF